MRGFLLQGGNLPGIVLFLATMCAFFLPVHANIRYGSDCDVQIPPIEENQTTLLQRYYFEGCDFGNTSVLFCPRPLIEKAFSCIQKCVVCHDETIPWHCLEWESEGCDPNSSVVAAEPCGLSYNGSNWTLGDWIPLDSSQWICPNARKLAQLYTPQPSSLSFNDLSIGGGRGNLILRSGETAAFTFSAYVPACLNRIPMLRLNVQLKNSTGDAVSHEYGLYVKHQTVDYLNEDRGIIEDFAIPNMTGQDIFRESYNLSSSLDGYVSWAWRRQFVEAVEKIVNVSEGTAGWKPFSGEVPTEAGRVGDIYFSSDFVSGSDVLGEGGDTCAQNISMNRVCSINTLPVERIGATPICSSSDLIDYYNGKGLTSDLRDLVASSCNISSTVHVDDVSFSGFTVDVTVPGQDQEFTIDTSSLFNKSYPAFKAYVSNPSNSANVIKVLKGAGYIKESDIQASINSYLLSNFGSVGCSDHVPVHSLSGFDLISINPNGTKADLEIQLHIVITEDFLINSRIGTSFEYNCTQSWSWGSISNLNSLYLTKCLYNWEKCMDIGRPGGFSEAASAGYGPMEATPTIENDTARILLDGRMMQENQSRNVTVYRSCSKDDSWLAKQVPGESALIYACPIEAYVPVGGSSKDLRYLGKPVVSLSYPYDVAEGQQYMVMKCARAVSLDEGRFVEKVPLGSLASIYNSSAGKKQLYVCTDKGWVPQRVEPTCVTNDDCPSGEECIDGKCCAGGICPCETNDECPQGEECIGGTCGCKTDDDCPSGQTCVDGACVCNGDSCCPTGQEYVDGACKCVTDDGCAAGQTCVDGTCKCKTDDGCPAGQNCIDGECINRYLSTNMFEVIPKMVNVGLGQGGFNIWSVNVLNKEDHSVDADLIVLSRAQDYPAAINWLDFENPSQSCGEGCRKIDITLPGSGEWGLYRGYSTGVYLKKAERLGKYEYDFVVKDKSSGNELYRDAVWLNVNSDAIGSESILGLLLVFLGGIGIVAWRSRK